MGMTTTRTLEDLRDKILSGERVSAEEGARLYRCTNLPLLGEMANALRERRHGDRTFHIVNRHINYTNICVNRCRFCAFSRDLAAPDTYTLSVDEVLEQALGPGYDEITELHIVGGLHPQLPYEYYLEMIGRLREALPQVHLQAFTAVEIEHFARLASKSTREVLQELKDLGLGSLPGGGAEVFAARVREELCPRKLSSGGWLNVMREAHELGLRSNATMLYGHIETAEEKAQHLALLRDLQDETGGFMSFIPLAYHQENTPLGGPGPTTGLEDLRNIAVARIMLDNFDHIKSFWIMLGLKIAQVSLWFGADDLDGTVAQEQITHSAGARTPEALTRDELCDLIREAGREPVERDTVYNVIDR